MYYFEASILPNIFFATGAYVCSQDLEKSSCYPQQQISMLV